MSYPIPRLPVLDWNTFSGAKSATIPCLLNYPQTQFTNSGRASILLALEMLGVGPGHKVLVPTYHCPTMIAPIVARDAEPVFYPLDRDGAPRLEWIEQQDNQGIRAILVAHFFGLPQRLVEVRAWCDAHKVALIEDCAHALFGAVDNRGLGRWGDLAIASLTKFLPVPEGGCLVNNTVAGPVPTLTRSNALSQIKAGFDIIHNGVSHGRLRGLQSLVKGLFGFKGIFRKNRRPPVIAPDILEPDGLAIDVAQAHRSLTRASRWMAQHASLERIVARRREHYRFFAQALSGIDGFRPLHLNLPQDAAPYVFALWVDQPDPGYAELRRLAFPVSRWDRLWPTVASLHDDYGLQWSNHIFQIACHQDLTSDDVRQMVQTLRRLFASNATPLPLPHPAPGAAAAPGQHSGTSATHHGTTSP